MCIMKKGKLPEMQAALLEAAKSGDLLLRRSVRVPNIVAKVLQSMPQLAQLPHAEDDATQESVVAVTQSPAKLKVDDRGRVAAAFLQRTTSTISENVHVDWKQCEAALSEISRLKAELFYALWVGNDLLRVPLVQVIGSRSTAQGQRRRLIVSRWC